MRAERNYGVAQSPAIVRASALDDIGRDPPDACLEPLHDARTPQGLESSYMPGDNFLGILARSRARLQLGQMPLRPVDSLLGQRGDAAIGGPITGASHFHDAAPR